MSYIPIAEFQPVGESTWDKYRIVDDGQSVTLDVKNYNELASYRWGLRSSDRISGMDIDIPGATDAEYSFVASAANGELQYYEVGSGCGSVIAASNELLLIVYSGTPVIYGWKTSDTYDGGSYSDTTYSSRSKYFANGVFNDSRVEIEVKVYSKKTLTYQWQKQNNDGSWTNISGATSVKYSFTASTAKGRIQHYRVIISDGTVSVTSDYRTIRIVNSGNLILGYQPLSQTVNENTFVTFAVEATGVGERTYTWQKKVPGGSWTNLHNYESHSETEEFVALSVHDGTQYRVIVRDENTSITSDPATLTVIASQTPPKPIIASQPLSQIVNEGTVTRFYAADLDYDDGLLTWQWQKKAPNGDWTNISGATNWDYYVTASADLNGTQYRAIVTLGNESVISDSATLTVLTDVPMIITQPLSQTVKENSNVIFSVEATGTGTLTYQWQKKASDGSWTNISGATATEYAITASSDLNHVQYRVKVSNGTKSTISDPAILTVAADLPIITKHPVSQTVRENVNVIFYVEASGSRSLAYQWQSKSTNGEWYDISGATSSEYSITSRSDLNGMQYRVLVMFGNSALALADTAVASEAATLTVLTNVPIITTQPFSQTVKENTNVIFSVEAAGAGTLTYQWQKKAPNGSWTNISGATNAQYSVTSTSALNGTQYRVKVSLGTESVTSEAATLTILMNVPTITAQPSSQTVNENTNVIFSVEASGAGTLTYQWQKKAPSGSWTNISGATNAQYSVTSTSALNGTQYRVIVSLGTESVTSETATLTVTSNMPEVTSHPADQTVDEGSMAFFAAAGRGVGTLSYQWQKKQGSSWTNLSGKDSTAMTFAVSLSDNGTQYRCAISNSSGTAYSNPATLTVRQLDPTVPPPTIKTQPSDQTVNIGSNVTFSVVAEGTDLSYQWQEFVLGTNPYIDISGATGSSYTFQALSGMTLRCIVSNAGGSASSKRATLTVERLAPTITEQPANQGATEGSVVTLEIEATPASNMETLSYQWYKKESNVWVSISGATQSTYSFTAQLSDNGVQYKCEVYGVYTHNHTTSERATSNIVNVSVTKYTAAPTILTQPSSQNVSEGTAVSLEVVAAGTQPINYKWQIKANNSDSWTNISGATDSVYTFTPNSTVYLRCVVSNSVGSVNSNTVTIQVTKSKPTIISQPPATLNVKEGDLVELSVVAAGSNLSYQWQSMSDGSWSDISGETSATLKFAAATGSRTDYRCIVSNDSGSTTSDTSHLTITGRPPIITTQPLSQVVDEGTEVTFRAEVASTGTTQYIWLKKAPGENWTNLYNERTTEYTHTALFSENGTQYKLLVSANGQSVFSDPATLVVREKKITITSQPTSKTVKENTNVIFSVEAAGAGTLTYQWQKKPLDGSWTDISGATSAQYSVTASTFLHGSQYRVIVSSGTLSVTSDSATLNVIADTPIITSQPTSKTVKENTNVIFSVEASGAGTLTYQWQKKVPDGSWTDISGATSAEYSVTSTSALNGTQYRVAIYGASAAVLSDSATLTVLTNVPLITSQPTSKTVKENTNVIFLVEASGAGTLTYQWQKKAPNGSWTNISGATSAEYSVTSTSALNGTQYRVIVSLGNESVTSDTATLNVLINLPTITSQPLSQTVNENVNVIFSVTASGEGTLTYQWEKKAPNGSWTNISGATSAEYSVTSTPVLNGTQYRVKIRLESGGAISDAATLTVLTNVPTIITHPVSKTVNENVNVIFSVEASGAGTLTYQWQKKAPNGSWTNISGATNAQYSLTSTSALNGTQYRVKVSLGNESVTSEAATLNVLERQISIVKHPLNKTVNEQALVTFDVEVEGNGPLSYQWQKKTPSTNWTNILGATNPNYTFTALISNNNDQYRVIVTSGSTTLTSDAATLTVLSNAPTVTQNPQNASVEENESVTLTAQGSGTGTLSYQWQQKDNGAWGDISGANQNTYTFVASLDDDETEYRCAISNSVGTVYTTGAKLQVAMIQPVITTQPESQTAAEGDSVTFSVTATGSDIHHQWQISTDGETWINLKSPSKDSYTNTASINLNGCQIRDVVSNNAGTVYSDPATLTVTADERLAEPVITTQPSTLSLIEDQTGAFTVAVDGEDVSYQWQILQNEVWCFINGANEPSLSVVGVLASNGSKYRCVISNPAGTVYSDEVVLLVSEGSKIKTPSIYSQPRSVSVESGTIVYFRVLANGGSLEYKWERKRGNTWYTVSGATTNVLSFRATEDMSGDQYRCWVTNPAGGEASTLATLTVTARGPVPMYGYHSIIISGKNTYGEWTMYPTSRPHISPPEVKTSYVEVPGADGGLDYTELLNDKPNYGYRKGSWEFLLIPQDQWPNVYRSLCNFLHGREHTVVLEDDPNWMYTGRLSVNEWRSAAHNSLITIDYILDPDPVNISGEEYNQDELDLEGAERILRKPGNTDKAIVLWNNVATVVPITDMYEDGDNIAY